MTARQVAILGVGKRVIETALPAFHRLPRSFWIRGIWARSARRIEVEGQPYDVQPFDGITLEALKDVDLIYLCVGKESVPKVLARLLQLEPWNRDLLIDTPVVRFKYFRHAAKAREFRHAWVPEDCTELPWIQAALAAVGPLHRVEFDRSAYAYHGVATARALFAAERIPSGRRLRQADGTFERTLRFDGKRVARIVEPRDYSKGRLVFVGQGGTLSDAPRPGEPSLTLAPVVQQGLVTAITAGQTRIELDAAESELTRGDPDGASITARMEAMKRVGFLRILRRIQAGKGGYPLDHALEDMVVDYFLEKLGRWVSTPLTSPHTLSGRALLSLATLPASG
jgi:hypothetical protein